MHRNKNIAKWDNGILFQIKEKEKTPENEINETETSNLLDKEFKAMGIKILNKIMVE